MNQLEQSRDVSLREMSLDEYLKVLHPSHRANRQMESIKQMVSKLEARIEQLEKENAELYQKASLAEEFNDHVPSESA